MNALSPNLFNIYRIETSMETRRMLRSPGFAIPALLFPIMFYVFFGILFNTGGINAPTYLLASYGTFGVIGPALFSFGVGIAVERGQGWFDVKESSPMPASAYLVARVGVTTIFAIVIILSLFTIAAVFANVRLMSAQWLMMAAVLLLGSIPFCAIGLFMGLYLKSNSAPAVVNLTYLPMSFLSGLWVPISFFPEPMQFAANFLPPYHLSQLALKVIDADLGGNVWLHIGVLTVFSLIFFTLAMKAYYKKDKSQ